MQFAASTSSGMPKDTLYTEGHRRSTAFVDFHVLVFFLKNHNLLTIPKMSITSPAPLGMVKRISPSLHNKWLLWLQLSSLCYCRWGIALWASTTRYNLLPHSTTTRWYSTSLLLILFFLLILLIWYITLTITTFSGQDYIKIPTSYHE